MQPSLRRNLDGHLQPPLNLAEFGAPGDWQSKADIVRSGYQPMLTSTNRMSTGLDVRRLDVRRLDVHRLDVRRPAVY